MSINIGIGLSIITIARVSKFVPLGLEQLNLLSNRLVAESKFQGRSGMKVMSRKCLHTDVLISMV